MRALPTRYASPDPLTLGYPPQYLGLVLEQRVAVGAALVGQAGDRVHPLVVVALDLVQLDLDPVGGAAAERIGDEPFLARGLDALLLEDRRRPREDRDLAVDVRQRSRQAP